MGCLSSPPVVDWCPGRDSNPHSLLGKRILSPPRLPFRHLGEPAEVAAIARLSQPLRVGGRNTSASATGIIVAASAVWKLAEDRSLMLAGVRAPACSWPGTE